jgi:hypothetical protein
LDPDALGLSGAEAYELVDELPRGAARAAAWNAYAFQTYADKLIEASGSKHLPEDTYAVVAELVSLSALWVRQASALAANPSTAPPSEQAAELPHFDTPIRSQEQLAGMRETADTLRTYVAFDLQSLPAGTPSSSGLRDQLAALDKNMDAAAMLLIERPPPELRGGMGDALVEAIEQARALGLALATAGSPG